MAASSISSVLIGNTYRQPTPALQKLHLRTQALPPMPSQSLTPTTGLSETFSCLKAKEKATYKPEAVGFGISTPEHVNQSLVIDGGSSICETEAIYGGASYSSTSLNTTMAASSISSVLIGNTYRQPTPALQKLHLRPQALPPMPSQSLTPTTGLSETFSCLKAKGKVAFIPYITAGDPDLQMTTRALKLLDSCGSDIIELGMPYSDPLLDGPVIQAASRCALAKGTTFDAIVSMLREVVPQLSCPIVLFSYYNPILKRGIRKFMSTIKNAGVHGLLVPDIPLEETEILRSEALKHNIELVLITTAITPTDRMKAIVQSSEGFVYLVRVAGVTGTDASVCTRLQSLLQEIKMETNKPVAVGFGISTPEHVNQLSVWGADGVIVGSALVKILGEAKSPEEGLKELETFTKSLRAAIQ